MNLKALHKPDIRARFITPSLIPAGSGADLLGSASLWEIVCRAFYWRYGKYIAMELEYDPEKSQANWAKHGIDFEQAKELWADGDRLVIPARSETEFRWAMPASFGAGVRAAFYTLRDGPVRLISVRRARTNGKATYESGRSGQAVR